MRESDWSRANLLRSDWLPTSVAMCTTDSHFFRPLSSVHLFQSNQRFQAIEFVDRQVLEKLLI